MTAKEHESYSYYAFISYSSKDLKWGKRLQRKLENYRMPATLCSERGWKRCPINPVFFAPTDIQPGTLSEEIKARLRASKNLIVISSPNSAKSDWVGNEIRYFHELGRDENLHFFIVDGVPNSGDPATECFNPVVRELGIPEKLGANIHEKNYRWQWLNRERAYVQLISKLLGVEFDSIWKRHRRRLIAQCVAWSVGIVAVLAAIFAVWVNNQPFTTKISLEESTVHNSDLPPLSHATVTLHLDGESKTDTIFREGEHAEFVNIPHSYLDKDVRVTFSCTNFLPVDTTIALTRDVTLKISRDAVVFGEISKKLWLSGPEQAVINQPVRVDRWEAVSDSMGMVKLTIPLDAQKERYLIEVPDYNLTDTLFMPCGEDDVIVLDGL
ncbi:MAG: toll/interleukin-1 receptor domain-containing protein [Muribaculaceae bacterium]|nr:toll/interleukin-1 receptor domain-containing protein [Muribaculaceae bacterium]